MHLQLPAVHTTFLPKSSRRCLKNYFKRWRDHVSTLTRKIIRFPREDSKLGVTHHWALQIDTNQANPIYTGSQSFWAINWIGSCGNIIGIIKPCCHGNCTVPVSLSSCGAVQFRCKDFPIWDTYNIVGYIPPHLTLKQTVATTTMT